jgi:CubicO group peptidase (beta-lactamase class C family)
MAPAASAALSATGPPKALIAPNSPNASIAPAAQAMPPASAAPSEPGVQDTAGALTAAVPIATATQLWPEGDAATPNAELNQILADDHLAGPGARALLVIDHGHIIAERYAPGFSATTPLLGWSMSKSVIAGLIGMLVKDGTLNLEQAGLWSAGDGRERIRIADLLAMTSGLQWNEGYGSVSDVTDMLYLQGDMAAFARSKPLASPVGTQWIYSSGTAVILSRILGDAASPDARAYIKARLYQPLGITSMTMEQDEHGTLVGSSYMYATARDWARYAQFLVQDGVWQGGGTAPLRLRRHDGHSRRRLRRAIRQRPGVALVLRWLGARHQS